MSQGERDSSAHGAAGVSSPSDGLAAQLRELEAFVARSEASGDAVPTEAVEMIARLREIVVALEALTSSLRSQAPDASQATGPS